MVICFLSTLRDDYVVVHENTLKDGQKSITMVIAGKIARVADKSVPFVILRRLTTARNRPPIPGISAKD